MWYCANIYIGLLDEFSHVYFEHDNVMLIMEIDINTLNKWSLLKIYRAQFEC